MATATNSITIVASLQDRLSKPLQNIDRSTSRLEKQFTKLSGAAQNAFQFYVRYRIFNLISQGISAIENAIPSLIARGQEWAQTVDDIADSTGLAASRASTLAGVAQVLTGDADGLTKALGALSTAVVTDGSAWEKYGIRTRDANDRLLDTWTILGNVRRALADAGNGFLTTAAARDLFSRGGQQLLDLLTLTDRQFRMLEQDARRSGVVMSEAGLRAAEQWQRTQQRFEQSLTGIGNLVTTTVQPVLTRLVDGITEYIRANMTQIVGFVSRVVGFVTGVIAGFLGIDLQMASFAERIDAAGDASAKREATLGRSAKARASQAQGEDAYTKAVERQIGAIDRQLAAMSRQDSAQDAREEQRRLLTDIAAAKKELEQLRGEGIFAAGMSAAEAELARQAQAADIVDAQKKVMDAQTRMREHGRDQAQQARREELEQRRASLQEQLAEHQKALSIQASRERRAVSQAFGKGTDSLPGNIKQALQEGSRELRDALGKGGDVGAGLRTAFDGLVTKLTEIWDSLSKNLPSWVDSLSTIAGHLSSIADMVSRLVDRIAAMNPFGPEPGKVNLGLKPEEIIAGAGAAYFTRGLWKPLLGRLGGGVVAGGAAAAGGTGAAAGIGRAAGVLGRVVAPVGAVLAWKDVFDTINANSATFEAMKSGNFSQLDEFLKTASSAELSAAVQSLRDLPGALDPVSGALYNISSGFAGLDVLLGDAKRHNEEVIAKLEAELQARKERDRLVALSQAQLRTNTQSGGRSMAAWTSQIATNTRGLNTILPWGVANVTLNIDGRTAMTMLGIPIRRGNSTTRISPTT